MRKTLLFALASCGLSVAARAADAPKTLTVRAVAWDASDAPRALKDWTARVAAEVAGAVEDGADVVVFPEGFADGRDAADALAAAKAAAGPDRLVVFGGSSHAEPGWDHAVVRARVLSGGAWQEVDALDLTPEQSERTPPVKPGMRLPLFRFRGGLVAALGEYSLLKPEISASLKRRGVSLILVSAAAPDADGAARLERCAAARAVELGAAVAVVPSAPRPPALYLPAQKGFDLRPPSPRGRDLVLPWRKLLELRTPPKGSREPRPFLDRTPFYQVEI